MHVYVTPVYNINHCKKFFLPKMVFLISKSGRVIRVLNFWYDILSKSGIWNEWPWMPMPVNWNVTALCVRDFGDVWSIILEVFRHYAFWNWHFVPGQWRLRPLWLWMAWNLQTTSIKSIMVQTLPQFISCKLQLLSCSVSLVKRQKFTPPLTGEEHVRDREVL